MSMDIETTTNTPATAAPPAIAEAPEEPAIEIGKKYGGASTPPEGPPGPQ
jgi:hypothetical protein